MRIRQTLGLGGCLRSHLPDEVLNALDNLGFELSTFILQSNQGMVMRILLLNLIIQSREHAAMCKEWILGRLER